MNGIFLSAIHRCRPSHLVVATIFGEFFYPLDTDAHAAEEKMDSHTAFEKMKFVVAVADWANRKNILHLSIRAFEQREKHNFHGMNVTIQLSHSVARFAMPPRPRPLQPSAHSHTHNIWIIDFSLALARNDNTRTQSRAHTLTHAHSQHVKARRIENKFVDSKMNERRASGWAKKEKIVDKKRMQTKIKINTHTASGAHTIGAS